MLLRRIARPLLATPFVVGGTGAIMNPDDRADQAAPLLNGFRDLTGLDLDDTTMVQINGGIMVAAGAMLATGRFPRISAMVLAGSLVPTTLAGHRFWDEPKPSAKRRAEEIQFTKNLAMLGGVLLAAGDTEGRPGLGWRARRSLKDARRMMRTIERETKLTGSLVEAKVDAAVADARSAVTESAIGTVAGSVKHLIA